MRKVILLVRMWVENTPPINVMIPTLRHPPCEDVSWKYPGQHSKRSDRSHPPCEDVSWKVRCNCANEMKEWSSSLWGCELKRICKWYHPLRIRHPPCEDVSWKVKDHASEITETVILLVRMWVEKLYGVARHYRTTVILLVRMWVEKWCTMQH